MRSTRLLLIGTGGGLAVVVGREGSVVWVVVRVLAVVALTHLTVLAQRRGERLGPIALVAFGVLAAAVGGGVAAPYAREVGWDLDGGVATATMVLGLALVAIGTVRLVRTYHRWARLGALAVVCVAAYLGLAVVAGAVTTTNVPRVPVGAETPVDRGLRFEEVRFRASDGVVLAGWFVPPSSGDTVVLVSDSDTTRSAVLDQAEVLGGLGFGVLLFDPRGEGESGGRAMALGWEAGSDAAGAVDYLTRRPEVGAGRIMVVGVGAGAAAAISVAAHPHVCAVVAEGTRARTAQDRWYLAARGGAAGLVRLPVAATRDVVTDVLTAASHPASLRSAVAAPGAAPMLLIATTTAPDEPRLAAYLHDAAPRRVTVWDVPGAGSGTTVDSRRGEWRARLQAFFAGAAC